MSKPLGRKRRTREEIAEMVSEFRRSGCTAVEFASRQGIHWVTLHRWLRRERSATPPLVPVKLRGAEVGSTEWAEVISPTGWRIRVPPGTGAATLREWVGGLSAC